MSVCTASEQVSSFNVKLILNKNHL